VQFNVVYHADNNAVLGRAASRYVAVIS